MKYFVPILGLLLLPGISQAQKSNPFKSIGKTAKVQTLSNGKYIESFDDEVLQRVGTVVINRRTKKIVDLLDADKVSNESSDNSTASRWYSIDPLAEKFYSQSPYSFAGNNPIYYVDIAGAYQYPASKAKAYTDKYPNLTAYLSQNVQKDIMRSPTILNGFAKYSGGNLTREETRKATAWGSGPKIAIVDDAGFEGGANGRYDPKSNTIELNTKLAKQLEDASPEDKQAALYGVFGTLTHETVHYGDYLDGNRQEPEDASGFGGEPGTAFSLDVFYKETVTSEGQKVQIVDPSLDHTKIPDAKRMMDNNKRDGKADIIPTLPTVQTK